jgi:hypothetical protein
MHTEDHTLFLFWAKTTHDHDHNPHAYHPLLCHMIDVAAVAHLMWEEVLPKAAKKRLAHALGLSIDIGRKNIENEETGTKNGWLKLTCSPGSTRSVV